MLLLVSDKLTYFLALRLEWWNHLMLKEMSKFSDFGRCVQLCDFLCNFTNMVNVNGPVTNIKDITISVLYSDVFGTQLQQ